MPTTTVRFHCKYCNKTIAFPMDDAMQADFKAKADKWPYPMLVPHSDHWAVVYLDQDFHERSVVITKATIPKLENI
jgi:hypothetical protein